MRRIIDSSLGTAFAQKTIPALVVVAIFSLLLVSSTMAYTDLGTTDEVTRDAMASETGLGPAPFSNYQGEGANFIKAGVTIRVFGLVPPQNDPFVLTVPALPPGAAVEETLISWSYLLDGTPPATDVIAVNGNPVTGTLCGQGKPDLCWGKGGVASYMATGVSGFVAPGPAPVAVTIGGATDKPVGADPNAYGEGLTILVVYKVPNDPWRTVDLYRGYISTQSGSTFGIAVATLNYTVPYQGGDFHFFLNAMDGQATADSFLIDGICRGGQVSGTGSPSYAWQGSLGPAPNANLYDHANDDISAFLTSPDPSLDISTVNIGTGDRDCVGHSFAAISFPAERPDCPDVWIWPNLPPYPYGQWDDPDITLSAIPYVNSTVTITAKIRNSGPVTATANISFDLCHIGGSSSPSFWTHLGATTITVPGNLYNYAYQSWPIPSQAEGHSCVVVTIMQPTVPPECNLTRGNVGWENLCVLPVPSSTRDDTLITAIPVLNPEHMPMDIYIQFKKTSMPAGWDAWIADDLLEQVAPGDTQSVIVCFYIPSTTMVGDFALANFEAFLSSPTGTHIGGTDIKAIVVEGEAQIPTLSEWGMIIFVVLLAGWMTFVVVRRWKESHATG